MVGEIREIAFSRALVETGNGSEVAGYAIRVWVEGPEEGDETLALTITGPLEGPDGNLGALIFEEPVRCWVELVMGNR
jgi:hypothetical protein